MNIDAKEIELIVQKVLENIDVKTLSTPKAIEIMERTVCLTMWRKP